MIFSFGKQSIRNFALAAGALTLFLSVSIPDDATAQGKSKDNKSNSSQSSGKGKNKASTSSSSGSKSKSNASSSKKSNSNTASSSKSSGSSNINSASTKEKNLNAQLKSLNSLKRNPEALLNSSDKKLGEIQTFLANKMLLDETVINRELASQALALLTNDVNALSAALAEAEQDQLAFTAELLGVSEEMTALQAGLEALDPATQQDQIDALNAELALLDAQRAQIELDALAASERVGEISAEADRVQSVQSQAQTELAVLQEDVDGLEAITGDDNLSLALVSFLVNSGQTADVESITPEMLDWAKQQLAL